MGWISKIFKSAGGCIEEIRMSTIRAAIKQRASSFGLWRAKKDDKMLRLQTIAKLHESMFEIHVEMHEYEQKLKQLQTAAQECVRQGGNDTDLMMWYKRIRATELQKNALLKSENIIRFTINGLENQGMMENMNRIISYTVKQHKLAQDSGLLEGGQEDLSQSFEQVSNHVARSQEIIDSLDIQSSDILNTDDMNENMNIQADAGFNKWKETMTSCTKSPDEIKNTMQDTQTSAITNVFERYNA